MARLSLNGGRSFLEIEDLYNYQDEIEAFWVEILDVMLTQNPDLYLASRWPLDINHLYAVVLQEYLSESKEDIIVDGLMTAAPTISFCDSDDHQIKTVKVEDVASIESDDYGGLNIRLKDGTCLNTRYNIDLDVVNIKGRTIE